MQAALICSVLCTIASSLAAEQRPNIVFILTDDLGCYGKKRLQSDGPIVRSMPPMGLDDQQLGEVLTYVRSDVGNRAPAVKPDEVKAIRDANSARSGFRTQEELCK